MGRLAYQATPMDLTHLFHTLELALNTSVARRIPAIRLLIKGAYLLLLSFTDMIRGVIGDMAEMKVVESYYSKKMVVSYASEAAEMIVRVDDIIKAAPRKRTTDNHPC